MEDIKNRLRNGASLSSSEVERRVQNIDNQKAEGITLYKVGTGVLALTLLHAVKLFGVALVLWLGAYLFAKEATYKQILAICSYSFLILVPELLLKLTLVMAKGTTDVQLGPAALLPADLTESVIYSFLENLNLFNIWMVILLIIGLSAASHISRKKSAAIVLPLWAAWILASTFLGGLVQISQKVSELIKEIDSNSELPSHIALSGNIFVS